MYFALRGDSAADRFHFFTGVLCTMSQLSRLARLRKRREQTLSQSQRRRRLVAGFEPLEDRRLLAITTSFAAGVLTFTGDTGIGIDEKVVIESTATPGTINYDDGSGLGSTTQASVNSVVFNGFSGLNEMIIINQAPSVFRPFAGGSFGIQFNVAGDPDFDVLRIAGGSAGSITSGSYTVSSPTSGTISYSTSVPSTIDISFSGLDSTGLTPDRVDDVTNQAGTFLTNSSTGAESVVVKVGPVLPPVQAFTQGPVFIDGGDREDFGHGGFVGGVNINGWKFMEQGIGFVNAGVFNAGAANSILIVGTVPGSRARAAVDSAIAPLGLVPTYVTGAAITGATLTSFRILYVPSDSGDVAGGITPADLALLAARTSDIQAFVRSGGGIFALTEGTSPFPYSWLQIPAPFTITSFGGGGISNALRKTPEAIAAGLSLTNAELSAGVPYHNVFTGPVGFNGLDIFVLDTGPNNVVDGFTPLGDDRAVTLGQGAINQTVGGGPTTTIGGNQMTLINLGNKLVLNLDARGGTDAITVDGTVLSLDGLLAPLNINGGGNGDSLLIDDSADNVGGDAVSVTSLATTGLAAFPISYADIGPLSVRATQGADTLTLDFSAAGPSSVHIFGGLAGDLFTGPSGYMRASTTIPISVHGGVAIATPGPGLPFNPFGESGDKFNLDMTTRADGSPVLPVVIVDTNGGNAVSSNTQLVRFTGIEDIDVLDGGVLTNTVIGDFYLRGVDGAPDYIEFRSAGQMNPTFRVRVGNTYYPSSTGQFGPYMTATGKVYVYGRGGNDTITMFNTRLDAVIFGEAGNDVLTGGYGNDLLIGGQGDDRINGAAVGGNDEIWGDDFDPVLGVPSVASQAAGGHDQISTFGGSDTVYGQGGNDIINTGGGADYVNGGPGDDQMNGQAGDDRLYGGSGIDNVSGSDGHDIVAGNAGNDTLIGDLGNDILIGGLGEDIVNGGSGGDAVVGDESNNAGGSGSLAKNDIADAALLALLTAWGASPVLGSLGGFGSAGDDGSVDTLWGGTEADAFFGAPPDNAADRNAVGYGPDLN